MKVTLLGTGTSNGVPVLGCECEVCKSNDARDKRLRCVALLETESTRLLIDCGPDIRQQLLALPFNKLDGVLLTHIHYDHVAGIDDLRPYCWYGDIHLYANQSTAADLRHNMPYCFTTRLYPGVPLLNLHTIEARKPFRIGDIDILPIEVLHGEVPILAFRFGKFAYITDMKSITEENFKCLEGVETLVVNALRFTKKHHSHQLVDDAILFARRLWAKQTILTHVTHDIGLYEDANARLPHDIVLGYDGMTLTV